MIRKWSKIDGPKKAEVTYDFYAKIHPALPYPKVEQFADSKAPLGVTNERGRSFDVPKILDDSLLRSASVRGIAKRRPALVRARPPRGTWPRRSSSSSARPAS